jgi:hypothetical protein
VSAAAPCLTRARRFEGSAIALACACALLGSACSDPENGAGQTESGIGAGAGGLAGGAAGTGPAGAAAGAGAAGAASMGEMPLPLTDPNVMACVDRAMAMGTDQACSECTCQFCMEEADAIYLATDPTLAAQSQAIVDCARANCCAGATCYCQTSADGSMIDLTACLTTSPAGPCVAEIEAAAGGQGIAFVTGPCEDPNNGCGAANALGRCATGDPSPISGPVIVGHCTDVCMMCM